VESRQADQLAVAIRSPVAAEEDQQGSGIKMIGKNPGLPGLIGQPYVGGHVSTLIPKGARASQAEKFFSILQRKF
jgi:hypothetical protein